MGPFFYDYSRVMPIYWPIFPIMMIVILIWTLAWKGLALWRAAQKKDSIWFIALLIINTLGILEILYIYVFSKWDSKKKK